MAKNEYLHKCSYCDAPFNILTHYKRHVETCHPGLKKKVYKCKHEECLSYFGYKQNRTKHYVRVHKQLSKKEKELEKFSMSHLTFLNYKTKQLPCKFCDVVVSTLIELTNHIESRHDKRPTKKIESEPQRYSPPKEKIESEFQKDFPKEKIESDPQRDFSKEEIERKKNPKEKIYACQYFGCTKIYGHLNCLVRHVKSHDKVWPCKICNVILKSFAERADHYKWHKEKEQTKRKKEKQMETTLFNINNVADIMWTNLNGETSSML